MDVGIIGLGLTGRLSATTFQSHGHLVTAFDHDKDRADRIHDGSMDFDIFTGMANRNGGVRIAEHMAEAVDGQDCVFVCVDSPPDMDGRDFALASTVSQISDICSSSELTPWLVVLSPVMPDKHVKVRGRLPEGMRPRYVVKPEFARYGMPAFDFFREAHVFGLDSVSLKEFSHVATELYPGTVTYPLGDKNSQHVFMSIEEASLYGHARNVLDATLKTFSNEMGRLSKEVGADARRIMDILDQRGLNCPAPGTPFGERELSSSIRRVRNCSQMLIEMPLLNSLYNSNRLQTRDIIRRLLDMTAPGDHVGFFGLSPRHGLDDIHDDTLLDLARHLVGNSRQVTAFDRRVPLDLVSNERVILSHDINSLDDTDLLVLSDWAPINMVRDRAVFDLAGISELAVSVTSSYEGLYW